MAGAVNIKFGALIGGFTSGIAQMSATVSGFSKQLNSNVAASFAAADRESRVFDKGLGRLASNMQSFGKQATVISAGIALLGATSFQTYAQLDALQLGLQNITGSAKAAEARFGELREVAKLPGLGLEEAAKGDVRLQAVGFSAITAKNALLQFGNAIALTGGGKFELDSVITQLTQMGSKAKVLAEDLKPILTASPAVAKAIKEMFGTVDSEQISKKLQAAGRGPQDFIQDLIAKLSELDRVAGGPKNAIENLGDSIKIAQFEFGKAADKALGLTGKINTLGDVVSGIASSFSTMNPATQGITLSLVAMGAAIGPVSLGLGLAINTFKALTLETGALRVGFAALTGPIGLTVLALAALGTAAYAVYDFNKAIKSTYSSAVLLAGANKAVTESVTAEVGSLKALLVIAKDETKTKQQRSEAIGKINALSPEYLGNLNLENINTAEGLRLTREYVKQIELKARAQYNASKLAEATAKLDEERAKKATEYTGVLDRMAAAGANLFNSNGKAAVNQAVTAKGVERQSMAVSDLTKTVDFYRRSLELTVDEQTKLGGVSTLKPFDYSGIGNGITAIKALKDEYKKLKDAIQSTIVTKGAGAVTPADRDRLKYLEQQIKLAKESTNPPKVKSEKPLTDLQNFVLAKKLIEEEIRGKLLKGLTVDQKTYFELEKVEQILRRIKGETEKDLRLKPIGTSALSLNLQTEEARQLRFIEGLKERLVELRQFGSLAFVQDQVSKIGLEIQKLGLKFGAFAIPQKAIADLAYFTGQVNKANLALKQAQVEANEAQFTESMRTFTIQIGGFDISAFKRSEEQLFDALQTLKTGIGEALESAGETALVGMGNVIGGLLAGTSGIEALPGLLLGTLGSLLTQLGQIAIQAAIGIGAIKTALKTLNPVVAAAAGVALIGLGALIKSQVANIAPTPFANGGLVYGPTVSLIGEGRGTNRNNPEVVAPLDKLKALLPRSSGGAYIPDILIEGSALRLVLNRADAEAASY